MCQAQFIYPVEKVISLGQDKDSKDLIEIGVMNFGDLICINEEGKIV